MTAIDWTATLQGYWRKYRTGLSGLFNVIADALTIRGNLCQPARRIDAL
jgi:hypothetical protein